MKRVWPLAAWSVMLVLAAGCPTQDDGSTDGGIGPDQVAPDDIVDISLRDARAVPATVTIRSGQAIRWRNDDTNPAARYSTVSGAPADADAGALWNSPSLAPGDSFLVLFRRAGTFAFFDELDPDTTALQGQIVVDP